MLAQACRGPIPLAILRHRPRIAQLPRVRQHVTLRLRRKDAADAPTLSAMILLLCPLLRRGAGDARDWSVLARVCHECNQALSCSVESVFSVKHINGRTSSHRTAHEGCAVEFSCGDCRRAIHQRFATCQPTPLAQRLALPTCGSIIFVHCEQPPASASRYHQSRALPLICEGHNTSFADHNEPSTWYQAKLSSNRSRNDHSSPCRERGDKRRSRCCARRLRHYATKTSMLCIALCSTATACSRDTCGKFVRNASSVRPAVR
jgi:hypothetical protein